MSEGIYRYYNTNKPQVKSDMYPLYWTTSKEGIFMRYSYEFKRKCVEMYYQGNYPDTPEGISTKRFRSNIREWVRIEEACGPDALHHKTHNKNWTPEAKLELVAKVIAGASIRSVSVSAGINGGMLYQWVRKYKIYGYNGLISILYQNRKNVNRRISI